MTSIRLSVNRDRSNIVCLSVFLKIKRVTSFCRLSTADGRSDVLHKRMDHDYFLYDRHIHRTIHV